MLKNKSKLPLGITLAVLTPFTNFNFDDFGFLSPYGALVAWSGGDVVRAGRSAKYAIKVTHMDLIS